MLLQSPLLKSVHLPAKDRLRSGCFLLLLWLVIVRANAQDMHFSQFYENPSLLNPALTGALHDVRGSLHYKDQWKSVTAPFRSMGASFDMRSPPGKRRRAGKFGKSDRREGLFGGGLSVYRDRAGDGRMGLTMLNLSLASFVPIGKRSSLAAGFQGGLVQRRLDYSNFIFPNQYSGNGYDISLGSNEDLQGISYRYMDYATGLMWMFGQDEKTFVTRREFRARVGAAMYHITQPKRRFIPESQHVTPRRYVVHGDCIFTLPNGHASFAPSVMGQMQGTSMEITGGMLFRYYMKTDTRYTGLLKRNAVGGGVFYRNRDAVIVTFLLEWQEQYAFGLSYDINTSPLTAASGMRGGLEITLRYTSANPFLYQGRN